MTIEMHIDIGDFNSSSVIVLSYLCLYHSNIWSSGFIISRADVFFFYFGLALAVSYFSVVLSRELTLIKISSFIKAVFH